MDGKIDIIRSIEKGNLSVGIIGLGYVGLPTAIGFLDAGFNVWGVDVSHQVVDTILYDKGRDYGSNIINFEKAPSVDINVGNFGQIGLTIVNGRIIDAFVQSSGSNYDGPPDITVTGVGSAFGAKLRAVMNGGSIASVVVLSQGVGYAATTTVVAVKAPGDAATFSTRVRQLVANKFNTTGTVNGDYLTPVEGGLALESVGYGETIRNYLGDNGSGHSPIIGWAYDGIPIYGPYGLSDPDNICLLYTSPSPRDS